MNWRIRFIATFLKQLQNAPDRVYSGWITAQASQSPYIPVFCVDMQQRLIRLELVPLFSQVCPFLSVGAGYHEAARSAVGTLRSVAGELRVRRAYAFTDSMELLLAPYADPSYPRRVMFSGEEGIDASGLTAEWFSVIGKIVSHPIDQDPAGALFVLKKAATFGPAQFEIDPNDFTSIKYLVINPGNTRGASLSTENRRHYFAFGRLMALAIEKKMQIGIPLPTFFFAKLMNNRVVIGDLEPQEAERAKYPSDVRKWGIEELEAQFPELGGNQLLTITPQNVYDVLDRVAETYMPSPAVDEVMQAIREGFETSLDLGRMRNHFTAAMFKRLVVGDDSLDIEELKKLTVRRSDPTDCIEPLSDDVYKWFFEWLDAQPDDIKRKCMQFFTGSSSLTARPIVIKGPEIPSQIQMMLPKGHTCFSTLSLPNYGSKDLMAEKLAEALKNDVFSMA